MHAQRKVLHSKLHRATITHADLDYEGSLTIPPYLMEAAKLKDYESIHIWNVTRGTRLETYAITGPKDKNYICSNGAAAHLMKPKDIIIIAAFAWVDADSIEEYKPTVVLVDEKNQVKEITTEIAGPDKRA